MNKFKYIFLVLFVGFFVSINVANAGFFDFFFRRKSVDTEESKFSIYKNDRGEEWKILKDEYDFDVTSFGDYPKFISGFIDPLDVKLGDTQHMKVVINSDVTIESVVAEIETDNDVKLLEMDLISTSTVQVKKDSDLPYEFTKTEEGVTITGFKKENNIAEIVKKAEAAPNDFVTQYVYEKSWVVEDTHTKTYYTKFIVTDKVDRSDDLTLAWSDPVCYFLNNTLQQDCNPANGVEGVDGTNYSLGSANITFQSGGTLAFNNGSSIAINNGSITGLNNGGEIKQAYIFLDDPDGDGYISSASRSTSQSTSVTGKIRLKDVTTTYLDCDNSSNSIGAATDGTCDGDSDGFIDHTAGGPDCDDGNPLVRSYGYGVDNDNDNYGQSSYGCNNGAAPRDATAGRDCNDSTSGGQYVQQNYSSYVYDPDQDRRSPSSAITLCLSTATGGSGNYYRKDTTGDYRYISSTNLLGTSDCDNSPSGGSVYRYLTGYTDADEDGYGAGSGQNICSGSSLPSNYVSNNSDCDDTKSFVNPGIANDYCYSNKFGYGGSNEGDSYNDNDCDGQLDEDSGCYCYDDDDEDRYDGEGPWYECTSGSKLGNDCYDKDGSIYRYLTGYTDADGDGRGTGPSQLVCSGSSLPSGYASNSSDCNDDNSTYWAYGYGVDNDNDNYGQSSYGCYNGAAPRDATAGTDCYDSSSAVNPGVTTFTGGDLNGGDYNCDGTVEYYLSQIPSGGCVERSGTYSFRLGDVDYGWSATNVAVNYFSYSDGTFFCVYDHDGDGNACDDDYMLYSVPCNFYTREAWNR